MKYNRQHKGQRANDVYWGNLIFTVGFLIAVINVIWMLCKYHPEIDYFNPK